MTTDLQARLLELNKLHAGAVLNKSAAGDHNHLAAANRALFKAWPDIRDEIARLTDTVERLEDDCKGSFQDYHDLEAKADALAEAAKKHLVGHSMPERAALDAALTDYRGDGK